MTKSRIAGLCAAAFCISLAFSAAPAVAESMKACNAEWSAMKANNTVGETKYADFRKECLARTAAAPAAPAATPEAAPAPAAAKPAPAPKVAAKPKMAAPPPAAAPSDAVFPSAVSPKYSAEKDYVQRRKTCLDQYHANQANNGTGNGGLKWTEKGGGYYHECNDRLKGV
jgi:hypothetical protein